MARLCAHAIEMIGDQNKAIEWLGTPNRALGGERPLDQLDTDTGSRMVEDVLGRIAPMASTADAVLANMPSVIRRRRSHGGGCSFVWRALEQAGSAHGLRLNFAGARRG